MKSNFSLVHMWLFALLLFSVKFFNITVVSKLFNDVTETFIYLFWLLVGYVVLMRHSNRYLLFKWRFSRPVVYILLGVLLSFIPAYIFYGQSLLTSFIVCRVGFAYLTLPVLLLIRPSLKDVKSALYAFSLLFFLLLICDSYLHIPLIAEDESAILEAGRLENSSEIGDKFIDGIHFVAMAFFFSLEDILRHRSAKRIFVSCFLFLTILLYQNRSTLFACVLITAFFFFTLPNTRRNIKIKTIFILVAILLFASSYEIWKSLLTETGKQIGDSDYNRNLAYAYFFLEAPQGFLNYILGCGLLSTKTTMLRQDMMDVGIYNSDAGFIGMWNQFGLIPIVTIIVCCCRSLKRNRPLYLKCNALFILICSVTISYFWQISTIVWLCIFFYIISLDEIRKIHIRGR